MTDNLETSGHDEASYRYDGWRIVIACFFLATFGWALGFYGQTVYLAELKRLHGWPSTLIGAATSFFYLFGAVLVMFISDVIARFGPRLTMLGGVVTMAVATVILGQVAEIWQLFAAYALLAAGWAGTSLGVVTGVIGLWFDRKRGLAISLALNGASFGGIIGVPLMVAAIERWGFGTATMLAAAAGIVVLVPAILLLVGKPPKPLAVAVNAGEAPAEALKSGAIRKLAIRDVPYVTMSAAFAITLFAQVGIVVHLISILDPHTGREMAALGVSLMTISAICGRLLFSVIIDRINLRLSAGLSFASQSCAVLLLIYSREPVVLLFACLLFGFSVGNLITLPPLIIQREFDPRWFGVLVSLLTATNQIVYSFGPGVVGALKDMSGSYTLPLFVCIALQLFAALLIMGKPKRVAKV